MPFLLRLLINAAALWVAIQLVDGIEHRGSWWSLLLVALLFGVTSRAAATEFAFLVGIPTMFAATAYEGLDVARNDGMGGEDWNAWAVAFIASAITAFIAVKWLLVYIQTHRFTAFAIYRFVLGAALLALVPAR